MNTTRASASVAVLTVTYGARWHLLSQMLGSVASDPLVALTIVVDNAATPPVQESLSRERSNGIRDLPIEVVVMGRNAGPAAGFAAALAAVRERPHITHVLLLDDDNVLERGGVASLVALSASDSVRGLVVAALRRGRREYEELLYERKKHQIRPDSFLGFHLVELPHKLLKARRERPAAHPRAGGTRELLVAPYGGLCIPMAWVRGVDLPRSEWVLYGDDHEYTSRLRRAGARLVLTDLARVRDVDPSWSEREDSNPWVAPERPAWRAYYASRNRMYLESEFVTSRLVYESNRVAYLTFLAMLALRKTRSPRRTYRALRPLFDAMRDVRQGVTGQREPYLLP